MSDFLNKMYKETYGVNPKTPQDAKDFGTMYSVWANTRDPKEDEQFERRMNVRKRMDENPNAGMFKFLSAPVDNTGVAHDNIDGILADNQARTLANNIKQSGSIGPTPFAQTDEGQEALLELAMGSAMPGAAIGRVSNKMLTGGLPPKTIKAFVEQIYHKPSDIISQIKHNNKLNSSRLAAEKALNKHNIPHESRKLMDPVSEILRTLKYKQN